MQGQNVNEVSEPTPAPGAMGLKALAVGWYVCVFVCECSVSLRQKQPFESFRGHRTAEQSVIKASLWFRVSGRICCFAL